MDYAQAFAISAAGMSIERLRVDTAALNLANADVVQSPGSTFTPSRVIARAAAVGPSFAEQVEGALGRAETTGLALPTALVEPAGVAPRRVYEPGHPFADDKGFVSYPGVDTATEMVTLMSALRAYEANVAALNTARTLALKTLDIGGGA